jgi:hypothetical protein
MLPPADILTTLIKFSAISVDYKPNKTKKKIQTKIELINRDGPPVPRNLVKRERERAG